MPAGINNIQRKINRYLFPMAYSAWAPPVCDCIRMLDQYTIHGAFMRRSAVKAMIYF